MAGLAGIPLHFLLLGLLPFVAYRYLIFPLFLSPLTKVPSAHWSASISPIWILHARFTHRENRTLLDAHRRLGPIVRVAPNELSINNIDGLRTVYQGGFDKPSWYSIFDNYGVPCMFSSRPGKEHSARKRMISHAYSKSHIQTSSAASAQARVILFERLLPILRHSTAATQVPHGINVHSIFLAATMDFISAYVWGLANSTNFLKNTLYREHWLEMYNARNDYGFFDQEFPWLTAVCRRVGIPLCPQFVDTANQELGAWNRELCDKTNAYLEGGQALSAADEPVVMKTLLSGLDKEAQTHGKDSVLFPTALTHHDLSVKSELFDHVLAGQETSGVTLSYLTWRLSQNLELQNQLREELLTLSPNLKLEEDGSGSLPDKKKLDSLPILHAVIMETLRLHAPIPGPQPRETPYPSCQIGPYYVQGGVRVAAAAYTLHRDEQLFPDPEKWDHTRWLPSKGEDEEEQKQRNRQFWAFSSGGRMCIGSNFAVNEMKLIVGGIYSNFTSHIVDDEGMAEQTDGYTSRPAKERLYLRFEEVK